MSTLYQIIMIALICAFVELVTTKTGTRYKLRDLSDELEFPLIAKMLDCDFCFGFWLSVLTSTIAAFVTLDPSYLSVPFFAAPIIRFLV